MHFTYQPLVSTFMFDHTLDRLVIEAAIELEAEGHPRNDAYQVHVPGWVLLCTGFWTGAVRITDIAQAEEDQTEAA